MAAPSFDRSKSWHGRSYTGTKVGRGHHWTYRGEWVERKLSPDAWEVDFRARKKRHGKAPAGSGAAVGTDYLWFFAPLAQSARKLDANTYETHLRGMKWKIGFRPATAQTWDFEWARTGATARQRAIRVLEQALADLRAEERLGASPLEAPALEARRPARKPRRARAKRGASSAGAPRGKAEA
jgi:hypothetical protein